MLVADPGARRLFTAAFTLSSERPGGSEGEDGSSRPRGFFGFGGATSDTEEVVTTGAEEEETRGVERSVCASFAAPAVPLSPAGCWTPAAGSMQGGGGFCTIVRGGSGSPGPQTS